MGLPPVEGQSSNIRRIEGYIPKEVQKTIQAIIKHCKGIGDLMRMDEKGSYKDLSMLVQRFNYELKYKGGASKETVDKLIYHLEDFDNNDIQGIDKLKSDLKLFQDIHIKGLGPQKMQYERGKSTINIGLMRMGE